MNGDDEDFAGWLGGELGYSDEDVSDMLGDDRAQQSKLLGLMETNKELAQKIAALSSEARGSGWFGLEDDAPTQKPKKGRKQQINLLPQYGNAAMWWGYDDMGRLVPFGKHQGGLWTATGRFIPNTSPEYEMHANF